MNYLLKYIKYKNKYIQKKINCNKNPVKRNVKFPICIIALID